MVKGSSGRSSELNVTVALLQLPTFASAVLCSSPSLHFSPSLLSSQFPQATVSAALLSLVFDKLNAAKTLPGRIASGACLCFVPLLVSFGTKR